MPSIGKDLFIIRTHLGLSIEDVHNSTKIPINTLQSIENGNIFKQKEEIKTYVRSFVRTYGKVLKIKDELILEALDQEEVNMYDHLLLTQYPELKKELEKTESGEEGISDAEIQSEDAGSSSEPKAKASTKFIADFPPDSDLQSVPDAEDINFKPVPSPGVRSVNWADMGRKISTNRPKTSIWFIGAVVVLIVVLASVYYLTQNDFSPTDIDPADQPTATEQSPSSSPGGGELSLNLTDNPESTPEEPAVLDGTLYLTIYAATERLDPVRVWSDLKPRIDPYWMERGIALNFEFRDSIRVRGQYSNMLLFMNGHLIPNFRQEHFNTSENAVEITRDIFEEDPRWASPVPFELPPNVPEPDSVANRPNF
jgi:hypothetical protein